MSDKFTHKNLKLAGRHLPEKHSEIVSAHERQTVELPGTYEIGAVIEGAFIPLARLKAGEVLDAIERAKQSQSESDDAQE
jgi:hypothetical protein